MTHARLRRLATRARVRDRGRADRQPGGIAGAGDFYSSFEDGEPAPTWTNTVEPRERAARASPGPTRDGLPGDVSDKVIAAEANGENEGAGEVAENLFDGSSQTKWLVFERTGWVECELSEPVAVVHYALVSANDAPGRDPRDWTLSGSNDGTTWTDLDTQTDQDFTRALPDQGVPLREHDRLHALPPRHHREPRRRHRPARRAPALQRRHRAAPAVRHDQQGRRRPARRLHRQVRRRLHRRQGVRVRRHARGRGPRLLLQQGLRRRRARCARRPSSAT